MLNRNPKLILLAVLAVILFDACKSKLAPDKSIAFARKDEVWQDFRDHFKYHMQTIGLTAINNDESVAMLISEPPPHTTIRELKDKLKGFAYYIEEKSQPIGYDGWIKDVVVVLTGASQKKLDKLVGSLSAYLYGSDYKAYSMALPVMDRYEGFLPNLNYKIQPSELNQWFIEQPIDFYSEMDPSYFMKLSGALALKEQGILYSKEPGFVVWMLASYGDISASQSQIRKFCLDADLILGAISHENGALAIIGRERQNSVWDVPPLRTETVQMLASADKEEIAQSYERTALFAGKIEGGKDWAPIYLSKDLLNTEYGNLLNITDQMLKSWSMNGHVQYNEFNYTQPSYFTFAKSIYDVMSSSTLTFNWNTKGVGYTIEKGPHEFYCINRTGSLPVSYIPEGFSAQGNKKTTDLCEEKAYDYFSWLGNVELTRVVQYAALYQIFSRYNISASLPYYSDTEEDAYEERSAVTDTTSFSFNQSSTSPLTPHLVDLMTKFRDIDADTLIEMLDRQLPAGYRLTTYDKMGAHWQIQEEKTKLDDLLYAFNSSLEQAANSILNRNETHLYTESDLERMEKSQGFVKTITFWMPVLMPGLNLATLRDEYVTGTHGSHSRWIKTPSVVVSWNDKDSAVFTGGHNLGAKVTPFKVTPDVAKGEIKVITENGMKRVLINENDIVNIDPTVLRKIATQEGDMDGVFYIRDINYTPRTIEDVIPAVQRSGVRGFDPYEARIERNQAGFVINGKQVENCDELVAELSEYARSNDLGNLQVHFENVGSNQAKGIIKSSEIKLTRQTPGARVFKSGEIFKVNNAKYDFSKAKLITDLSEKEIVVEIPKLATTKSRVRFSITGFLKESKDKIVAIVKKLLGRSKTENFDFYDTLMEELRQFNITPQDVLIEIDDCIICLKIRGGDNGSG
jgi:hypothetical protein